MALDERERESIIRGALSRLTLQVEVVPSSALRGPQLLKVTLLDGLSELTSDSVSLRELRSDT